MIPPTWAAASTTASGFSSSKNALTATGSSRSSSLCDLPTRFSYPLCLRLFQIAEPTSPLCPATKIFEFLSNIIFFAKKLIESYLCFRSHQTVLDTRTKECSNAHLSVPAIRHPWPGSGFLFITGRMSHLFRHKNKRT